MATVVIIGSGAMGSVYAGLMQDAGHEVHGVCKWEDHVQAVQENGLRVTGASGDRTVRLASFDTEVRDLPQPDLLIIATKSFDVESAAESALPLIGEHTVVQTIQNGLGAPDRVANIIGGDRLAIGVVGGFGASVPGPGVAHHNGMEMIRFGSYGTLSDEEIERSAEIWRSSGFEVKTFSDTDQMVWEKFIMNVAFSGTTCATGLTIGQVMDNDTAWWVARSCSEEAIAIAKAKGITLDVGDPIEHVRGLGSKIPNAKPSMLLDANLKRRCEVDSINGAVVDEGRKLGIPTPVNEAVSNIIRARELTYLDASERTPATV
ncbi:ketopantoate reductase family protein [Corynebacterium lubricantis]|uniref:ketopantoate reductase family protein n=1 Tax=Corynebacterium lubricantis TaxID=541095 RepID=UPI00036F6293|nr:2-dehydropantoate 2-reductase [Corynebacterium lubricantis]